MVYIPITVSPGLRFPANPSDPYYIQSIDKNFFKGSLISTFKLLKAQHRNRCLVEVQESTLSSEVKFYCNIKELNGGFCTEIHRFSTAKH